VAVLVALAGCNRLPGKPDPADRPIRPDKVLDFDKLFAANCSGCHGAEGKLGPAPPLNDKLFLKIIPDTELWMAISSGREGTLMPGFEQSHPGGHLTDKQVTKLMDGLRAKWGTEPDAKELGFDPAKVKIPSYTEEVGNGVMAGDIGSGKKAFQTACAVCHGKDGEGTKTAGAISHPAFLALISDQALRRIVITGRPDLGMPNFADANGRAEGFKPLTNQDVNDIMALLVSWREKSLSTFK
jgi:mono/diheme cytochrome c family protein